MVLWCLAAEGGRRMVPFFALMSPHQIWELERGRWTPTPIVGVLLRERREPQLAFETGISPMVRDFMSSRR
jgi:hypothetical protein